MRIKKLKSGVLLLLVFGLAGLHAQDAIPAAGGDASGSGGSASYSVGQVVYSAYSGVNGSVLEGVQQMFEISNITGVEEATGVTLQCEVYPNPASENLILKIEDFKTGELTYRLTGINGTVLRNVKITGSETTVSMEDLAPSVYFLNVLKENNEIVTFKVIKK